MNTITVTDLTRHGMAAVEEALKKGPVHILESDQPRVVILSKDDYERLTKAAVKAQPASPESSAWEFLFNHPGGNSAPEEIRARIKEDRAGWSNE